jgi:hypothetical protein
LGQIQGLFRGCEVTLVLRYEGRPGQGALMTSEKNIKKAIAEIEALEKRVGGRGRPC